MTAKTINPKKGLGPLKDAMTTAADQPEKAGRKQADESTKWKPGQSGNPRGRTPGTGEVAKLRASIAEHVPAIVKQLVDLAKGGDTAAARLLLERVIPPLKPSEQAALIAMPEGSLTDQGKSVLAALGAGALGPTQAAQLLTSLGAMAKLIETDELAARVAALEAKNGKA